MSLNAASEDIRAMLHTGLFGVSGTDLFSLEWGTALNGKEVDKQILVVDTEDVDSSIKDEYEQPTFTIFVRGSTSESMKVVHDRARALYEFMIQQVRQTLNGTEYVEFAPVTGLLSLGRDNNNRAVYSMNFFTFRSPL